MTEPPLTDENADESPRSPAPVDRPPVSRVGDELQARAHEGASPAEQAEIEEEAYEVAQEKGWDKDVTDIDKA